MKRDFFVRYLGSIVAIVLVLAGWKFLVMDRAVVSIDLHTDVRSVLKIYYSDRGRGFSESDMGTVIVRPDVQHYSFRLGDVRDIERIRIDPSEKPGTYTIRSIEINQWGYKPVRINSEEQFRQIQPANDIDELAVHHGGITIRSKGNDPFLLYSLPPLVQTGSIPMDLLRFGLLALMTMFFLHLFQASGERYSFVVWLLFTVFGLATVMSCVSQYNKHPDEWLHVEAAKYYTSHTLPPVIGSQEILATYSQYGMSRLNSGEVAYFVAGKFAQFVAPLQLDDRLVYRFFNLGLLGILCLLAARHVHFRILMLPVLLSPQIWYIFSYFNSEAFALFLILLIGYQMVAEDSTWNRLLDVDGTTSGLGLWAGILGLGLLLGLFLLCKLNFYFFGLFLFFYFLWRLLFRKTRLSLGAFFRMAGIVLLAVLILGTVRFSENYVNDFNRSSKIYEAREALAKTEYKPSTPLQKKFFLLEMKERGVSLKAILDRHRWGEKSFRSSFGEYGYMTVSASFGYYDAVRYAAIGMLILVGLSLLWFPDRFESISLFGITLFCGAALMGMTLYHSWTVDFQAQGRYFLPIVGMISIFFYHQRSRLSHPPAVAGFSILFLLALYNFLFVGLAGIEKLSMSIG